MNEVRDDRAQRPKIFENGLPEAHWAEGEGAWWAEQSGAGHPWPYSVSLEASSQS